MSTTLYQQPIPFLFHVYKDEYYKHYLYSVVKITMLTDETPYNADWMDDALFNNKSVTIPDIDIAKETYKFDSKLEALRFIIRWWKRQEE